MRLARTLAVAMLVAAALSVPQSAQAAPFKHPGVLVSRAQLDFVRANLGNEPWKSAWSALRRSSYASLSYAAKARSVVECGAYSKPDNGCSDERKDAMAAYTHALQWYLTKDARYAQKAIQIMDAWSAVITKHIGSNGPLQTGWAGANFSRAAELIKHTYSGWSGASRMAGKLRSVYLPTLLAGRPDNNGNWELIMTDAAIGIAVHLDDRAAFDKAVNTWRGRLPAYIYLKTDGSLPKAPPRSKYDTKAKIIDYWHGQTTFVDGLTQETCRDFWHTGWGLAAIAHTAETAGHQGVDLYAKAKHRLRFAMDLHARIQMTGSVPSWLCGGEVKRDLGKGHFEVGFNALHHRLGYDDTPYAKRWVEENRPAGVSHFLGWETLTHAQNPYFGPPKGVMSVYGVLADGQLTYTAVDAARGRRTRGAVLSTAKLGFKPKAMATLDFNTILITDTEGTLYRIDVRTNRDTVGFDEPVPLAKGYTHDLLAYDGAGHLFGIKDGTLRRYDINAVKPTAADINGNVVIGSGFTLKTLTSTGPDWILGTTADGRLISYNILGPGEWKRHQLRDSTWQGFGHLLSPGGGYYFGHHANGSLWRYQEVNPYDNRADDLYGKGAVDTRGWVQTLLSAQPGTVR